MGTHNTIVGPYYNVPFGEVVRQAWACSGITQREFAKRLGVMPPRVPEIFRSASITEALLDRCVVALGVRLEVRIVR